MQQTCRLRRTKIPDTEHRSSDPTFYTARKPHASYPGPEICTSIKGRPILTPVCTSLRKDAWK